MDKLLSVQDTIEKIIQGEIKEIVNFPNSPYIKFLLLSSSLEFLGACMDNKKFEENKLSEKRFNNALIKLMPKKYHKYAKKDSKINLYEVLRCGMIHKLKPLNESVLLTERKNLKDGEDLNITEKNSQVIVVLEDFYEDIDKACEKLKKLYNANKLPTNKLSENYIEVSTGFSGSTQSISITKNNSK